MLLLLLLFSCCCCLIVECDLMNLQNFLDLVIEYEHKSTTGTTEYVGEGTLEECPRTFGGGDRLPAVDCALVQDVALGAARLHHHTPTHRIEWIRDDTSDGSNDLRDTPRNEEWSLLGVWEHATGCVIEAEVSGTVDDDTLDGYTEALVETSETVRLEDLGQAVSKTSELTLTSGFADISCQPGSGKVKWVDKAQRGSTGGTTRCQVTQEVTAELGVLVDSTEEDLLVLVLEGEVQSLGWEVTDDVGEVTAPEAGETLFLGDTDEAIDHTLVTLIFGDLLGDVLYLEEQLDTLDGGDGRLGDGCRDTTGDEIFGKSHGISESRHFVLFGLTFTSFFLKTGVWLTNESYKEIGGVNLW